ncbi:MAG: hypothetical protein IIB31_01070 [Chloroflexi bacterium]|nr:hypothetical protein [Chloroflexota bacterium]
MASIEEAFAGLLAQWPRNGPALHPGSEDAARALALAVLEEAANEEGNPFPLEGEGYAKLQRRIEALGK